MVGVYVGGGGARPNPCLPPYVHRGDERREMERQGQLSRGQCGDATKPHSRIFNSLRLPASQPAPVAVAVASRGQQREREKRPHPDQTQATLHRAKRHGEVESLVRIRGGPTQTHRPSSSLPKSPSVSLSLFAHKDGPGRGGSFGLKRRPRFYFSFSFTPW